jgi:hypothetical protein
MACTGSGNDAEPKDTDVGTVDTGEDSTETDVPVDTERSTLTGTIRDPSGAMIEEDIRVQYCRNTACRQATLEDGTYTVENLEPGAGSFEVIALADDSMLATVFAPLSVAPSETRTVDVILPELEQRVAIPSTPEELEIAGGLFVTIGEGDISAPSPLDPAPTHLGAVEALDVGLPIEGIDSGTVLAMYYMVPFDYHADNELPIRILNEWGLGEGEGELYAAVYESFSWEKIDDLSITKGDSLTTASGVGLDLITTLAVVKKAE